MASVVLTKKCVANINKTRRRPLNPENWKRNVLKAKRNNGQEYTTSGGVNIPAKNFVAQGKVCYQKCHLDGCTTLDEDKKAIYQKFWTMGNYEMQRTYLAGLMELKQNQGKRRFQYFIVLNGERKEVCLSTFLHIHGISEKVVRNVREKVSNGEIAITDRRGLHDNRPNRNDAAIVIAMNQHIGEYPQYDNHYSRRNQGEKYLSSDLNVSLMFRQFIEKNPDILNCEGKEWLFRKAFKDSGLSIGHPKSDTCAQCDELFVKIKYSLNDIDRQRASNDIISHQLHSDKAYAKMYEDLELSKLDNSYVVLCFDLQQVLFTPTLTHSEMFYLRQFSTYNFCVFNGSNEKGYMYIWDETEGKRGVDEIASALLLHVTSNFLPLAPGQKRTLISWSDCCRGQNNNFQMVCLLLYCIKQQYFTTIIQKFLCTWHSFLPCDRQFALIERKKQVSNAYVPEDWINIIKAAQPSNPFEVKRLGQENIMKIKDNLDLSCFCRPKTLKISEIQVLQISSNNPSQILTRSDHNDGVWSCHIIPAPGQDGVRHAARAPLNLSVLNIDLPKKYFALIPLSESKQNDIRQMLKYLSPTHAQFYMNFLD